MQIAANGTSLFFDVEGAKLVPDGSAMVERPTVVLLHGGPGFDHSNFKPSFSALTDVAQVVYLDHRGNGRSDRSNPASWNLDMWADDVRAFCDALGIVRPIVLGWSFGGFVAMAYAARHPDHAAKLILQSTSARLEVDRIADAFTRVGGKEAGRAAKAFWTNHDDESMAAYMQHCLPLYSPEPLDPDLMIRCVLNFDLLKGFAGEMEMDLRAGLASVTCPTLVLSGMLDPITPPEASDEIMAGLPAGLGRLVTFERSGHFINETEPDPFFAVLRSFITEQ